MLNPGFSARMPALPAFPAVLALLALPGLLAGCSSITDTDGETARVVLAGEIPADLGVVTATSFELSEDPATGEVSLMPLDPDTVFVRPPFDETYDISQFGTFMVKLIASQPDTLDFRVTIRVDGRTRYDAALSMAADAEGTPGTLVWTWGL